MNACDLVNGDLVCNLEFFVARGLWCAALTWGTGFSRNVDCGCNDVRNTSDA